MKDIQRLLLLSMALSSLALVLVVICFPLVQFNLRSLSELVHSDMDQFKESTDSIWNDIVYLENSTPRDKRDKRQDDGFIYHYQPSKRNRIQNVRHSPRRVFAAPTVQVEGKPGRGVFTDSEYIGSLIPMTQKEPAVPRVCKIVVNPKCPKGQPGTAGLDGVDGEDGKPGTDGVPGEDGTEAASDEKKCLLCPAGPPGEKGLPGTPGASGEMGPRGKPGILKELPGPIGPPGPQGEIGEPGIPGPRGQMGISVKKWICPPGEKGPRGKRGPVGPAGPKGDTGEEGIQGVRGRRGSGGPSGPPGQIGAVGLEGPPGRIGFESHYCECPARSKGVRGKFTLPQVPPYDGDDDAYPKNLFTD